MSSAHCLMTLYIFIIFHENLFNGFQVTERTRIYHCEFQRGIAPKLHGHELRFLCSARRLMMLYISVKFHENILISFQVIERTRLRDGRTDRRTDNRGKNNMSPPLSGGGGDEGGGGERHKYYGMQTKSL